MRTGLLATIKTYGWGKIAAYGLIALIIVTSLVTVACNYWIVSGAEDYVFCEIEQLPENDVGLILGTSRRIATGQRNLYFDFRIQAAVNLYKAGKIKHLLVSGDNRFINYNEPIDMQKALLSRGVPDSAITLDYAGFRTLDSVVRSNKVFGQQRITIISQKFHTYRAIFISRHNRIDAIAFCAPDISPWQSVGAFRVRIREIFARVKTVIDLYILHKEPHFLGEQIEIQVD